MRTEVKRDQTKALSAQVFFFFFKELVVTISVKQQLCQMLKIEVYLGFWREEKFALLSKLTVQREMIAQFSRRDFSINVCLPAMNE